MSDREWKHYIEDIHQCTQKILKYTKGKTQFEFIHDELVVDAVIRNLQVIGEASKRIPDPIKTKYPSISWREIAGLRDILIHEYHGINYNILWDIITNEVPKLNANISKIINDINKI